MRRFDLHKNRCELALALNRFNLAVNMALYLKLNTGLLLKHLLVTNILV